MVEKKEKELLGELFQADNLSELRLSYSRISSFAEKGASALIHRPELSGDGIDLGKMTDILMFEPDKFNDEYIIFEGTKPTAQLGVLTDIILLNYDKIPEEDTLLNLVKINGLWSNIKNEELIKAKWEDENFRSYIENMFRAVGKTVITNALYQTAVELVSILKTHSYSKDIFKDPTADEEVHNQYTIEFRYKDFMIRGILDKLIINHKDKTIRMIDLKTGTPNGASFMSSFMSYRYYLQAAIYSLGVQYIKEALGLDDSYELLPFEFVYIGKGDQVPYIYKMSYKWYIAAVEGFKTKSGYEYKGLNQLLEEIRWHWDNQSFDLPREVIEKNGSLILKDDFIEINE